MSLVNAEQVNAVVINAATAGIVDCSMSMASTSGGSCVGTRVVFQSIALPTQCGGGVVNTSLTRGVAADFAGSDPGSEMEYTGVGRGLGFLHAPLLPNLVHRTP